MVIEKTHLNLFLVEEVLSKSMQFAIFVPTNFMASIIENYSSKAIEFAVCKLTLDQLILVDFPAYSIRLFILVLTCIDKSIFCIVKPMLILNDRYHFIIQPIILFLILKE